MTKDGKVPLPEDGDSFVIKFFHRVFRLAEAPGDWVRKNIVEANQQHYPYYHKKYRRVPTVDQCYQDDVICIKEADLQFKRDNAVENNILSILRARYEDCVLYEGKAQHIEKCKVLLDQYKEAETNWFIKYGDLGYYGKSVDAYMKQKHRMIWERRHGKVGTGMKQPDENGNGNGNGGEE